MTNTKFKTKALVGMISMLLVSGVAFASDKNMTKPGTTPLVTISAKLSNCKPKSLVTLSNLAKNPSKKSKIAAK